MKRLRPSRLSLPGGTSTPAPATDQVVGRLDFPDYLAAVRTVPDGRVLVSEFKFPGPDDVIARLENRYSGDLMAGTHGICIVPA
jgi:hypothetical protein